ncbi:hypothetical protein E8E13_009254 [Curvularia kusanoi]|uniref:Uncharacterized protein n=1 Tax=Curvularia kusanoi TaxID=90978 RepID=A0A9P4TP98_CURKU|nr:hypothetical protein E8E13_009254 [Curvularia kusanoi]
MAPRISTIVNAAAFIDSCVLIGLSIATIFLASDAYDVFTNTFPPGTFAWLPSQWRGDVFHVFINYNRSSEIKTYFAAGLALFVGLLGTFMFGASFQRPAPTQLAKPVFIVALLSSIVAIVCAIWSAIAEVQIKKSTCAFDRYTRAGDHYTCSIENAACNTLRFAHHPPNSQGPYEVLNRSCLQFRHARYMVIPIAAVSLILAALYAVKAWNTKVREDDESEFASEREGLLRL